MRNLFLTIISLVLLALSVTMMEGCIENNIPYPRIQANFTSFVVEDQIGSTQIDSTNLTLSINLKETANPASVIVTSYTISPNAELLSPDLSVLLNLTEPVEAVLRIYQDYTWTIKAVQNIERYFNIDNQVGSTTIDIAAHRVIASVPNTQPLRSIKVESIKLGPQGSTMTPDLNGQKADFTRPVKVLVTTHGQSEEWTIYIKQTEVTIVTESVDAWTNVAWVYGTSKAGAQQGVQYRIKGEENWMEAPQSWITSNGGSYFARLIHLSAVTTYQARCYSDGDFGQILEFTTGYQTQVPNASMEDWWLDGKVWCPWSEGGEPWWGTGNKGVTTLGASNSVPTDYTSSGTGKAAALETRFVGIGVVGKLGAGNIFAGEYLRTEGTNGVLSMGRPFTDRPTKVRGYFQYTSADISSASSELSYMKGKPDTCAIWCALIDSPQPIEVRTNPNNRNLFEKDADYVVAYGDLNFSGAMDHYELFEFELHYNSTTRVPRYILLTASASKYGDFFTGGNGSMLYVDDFELIYDY